MLEVSGQIRNALISGAFCGKSSFHITCVPLNIPLLPLFGNDDEIMHLGTSHSPGRIEQNMKDKIGFSGS